MGGVFCMCADRGLSMRRERSRILQTFTQQVDNVGVSI